MIIRRIEGIRIFAIRIDGLGVELNFTGVKTVTNKVKGKSFRIVRERVETGERTFPVN